jgi:hypothetical protein
MKTEGYLVPKRLLLFYLPFTLCFIIPNFLKMAPWIWDNIKVLYYWWLASAPLVALLLARLWRRADSTRHCGGPLCLRHTCRRARRRGHRSAIDQVPGLRCCGFASPNS